MSEMTPAIWLISGQSEAGKTRFCRQMIEKARTLGLSVGGVLSPAVFAEGVKTGIEVENLRSGERRLLATAREEAADSITPHWKFDPGVLDWGARALASSTPCDLLVVDELGPLELQNNQGWIDGIHAVDSRRYRLALVVIRSSLLATGLQRWPDAHVLSLSKFDPSETISESITRILDGSFR